MKTSPARLAERLLHWYHHERRELPWRGTTDPYRIWVSEIMLQQTRVQTVMTYYDRFLSRFPDVESLAAAPLDDVLANWAGLGYYRRARQMHQAARSVVRKHGGCWPATSREMRELPGIGPYTAAAVASIAFDEPCVALDGNAFRVLSRLVDERRVLDRADPRRSLRRIGQEMIESVPAGCRGDFTQALMELGATVCVPRAPRCLVCPWAESCKGLAAGSAPALPSKGVRPPLRKAEISICVAVREDCFLVRRRPASAPIMPGFWELLTVEGPADGLCRVGGLRSADLKPAGSFSHGITGTSYVCRVYRASARGEPGEGFRWMSLEEMAGVPLTTISRKALRVANGEG